ncbi:MAG: ADP-forming succinate--CoA ligase subunit beta [Myxococcales bacterium]|nr:ADP-forming succinate--CoA ligase subunit beta [Myxococcales bacterium]|tara:strand:+ start:833 stop:1993 length:1161 start_codon:yes stop_codon:yes gene_type:complete
MKIHEYQAKEILREYGVKTLEGVVCDNVDDAVAAAERLGFPCVVKAQIHAGGRGKGGGVKLAKNIDEAKAHANDILGMQLKTHQTGPEGQLVRKIFVEAGCAIARELYVGLVLDRETSQICVMASTEGGVEIEKVAEETPEKILKAWANPVTGLMPYQARELAFGLGLEGSQIREATKFFMGLYQSFVSTDASLAEINPLVVTEDDQVIALDAKFNFDDNAMFRQKRVGEMHDPDEEDPRELEAHQYDLSYIALDGNIGCMVNGAGLAMATMDIIKHVGGEPANFLDVGGSATKEKVTEAFKIILRDENVKAVFVNIFGGIAKCDVIAEGVTAAARDLGLTQPLVVRLAGTNVEKGKQILAESGLKIIPADDMLDGAQKVVAAASA